MENRVAGRLKWIQERNQKNRKPITSIKLMWDDQNNKIHGTALVVSGPNTEGLYTFKKILGTDEQVNKVPEGVRIAVLGEAFKTRPLTIDMIKTFQRAGYIENLVVEKDESNKQTTNVF
jgi:hypothetical protein